MRIIDRDIEFYRGQAEQAEANIRNCVPAEEDKHILIRNRNLSVVEALENLREVLDQ